MARKNLLRRVLGGRTFEARTFEGGPAVRLAPAQRLRRTLMACLLWEDQFYEDGEAVADRIAKLVAETDPATVYRLAVEARTAMKLRHAPLLVARTMARLDGHKGRVADLLAEIVRRPDEMSEFLAIYWRDDLEAQRQKQPLSAQVKKGLARAFTRFDAYQLAKYDRRGRAVRLKDVLFLTHARPAGPDQEALWRALADDALPPPDTWETALSAGADKRETFERLLAENRLGPIALLMNLRTMLKVQVARALIREALARMRTEVVLPYRFVTAARHAAELEPELEAAMVRCLKDHPRLPGRTVLLVDVSGSMTSRLAARSETTRMDAACGLAILAREVCRDVKVLTFSDDVVAVPPRRGFALRDAIVASQPHCGTQLGQAVAEANRERYDRLIVFTDEQSHDAVGPPKGLGYMVNVASAERAVGHGPWTRIDGFSEAVLAYIHAAERDAA